MVNDFKSFGIPASIVGFTGDKIKIEKILNCAITVMEFKIEVSKYEKGNGKCLHLQIKYKEELRVVFTGSVALMDQINKVPKDKFPFTATIIKDNERYQFT